ncbi:hypothetical protein ES708_30589 [subsurface metagenome]
MAMLTEKDREELFTALKKDDGYQSWARKCCEVCDKVLSRIEKLNKGIVPDRMLNGICEEAGGVIDKEIGIIVDNYFKYGKLFEVEDKPNAVEFLTKILPEAVRQKEGKQAI